MPQGLGKSSCRAAVSERTSCSGCNKTPHQHDTTKWSFPMLSAGGVRLGDVHHQAPGSRGKVRSTCGCHPRSGRWPRRIPHMMRFCRVPRLCRPCGSFRERRARLMRLWHESGHGPAHGTVSPFRTPRTAPWLAGADSGCDGPIPFARHPAWRRIAGVLTPDDGE